MGACSCQKRLQLTISGHLKMENGSKQQIMDKIILFYVLSLTLLQARVSFRPAQERNGVQLWWM